jgi:DNA-binding transcriptional LysR family regulator
MRVLLNEPLRGHLRILSTPELGRKFVAPLLSGFHTQYPGIVLELLLSDQPADFVRDRVDVAFRDGHVESPGIVARWLLPMRMIVCASPAYALMHGLPRHIDELATHRCINFSSASGQIRPWLFKVDGLAQRCEPVAQHKFNDVDLMVEAVLAGIGIAQLPSYRIDGLLAERKLIRGLAQYAPDDSGVYVCYLNRENLPSRIRVFVDYITARMAACDRLDSGVHVSIQRCDEQSRYE